MVTENIAERSETGPLWDAFADWDPARGHAPDRVPRAVSWHVQELPSGHVVPRHHHERAQLVYASRGVMTVTTDRGIWVVPSHRGVWVPPGRDHRIDANTALSIRNLYFDPGRLENLPTEVTVVAVSPLLRELILAATAMPVLYDDDGPDGRLAAVLADQIRVLPVVPLHLPWPREGTLARIAERIAAEPGDGHTLAGWAAEAGASERTLARRFVAETGMTFGQWRQQARLLEALRRLARGEPVTTIALDLGYESQSAFITMFRRALGRTPGKFFRDET